MVVHGGPNKLEKRLNWKRNRECEEIFIARCLLTTRADLEKFLPRGMVQSFKWL